MSKGGGAGKVYFVLYLAVILELLIIIVERDEAEEGLMQKQKESMKIVESILSQLQSGAGSEGMNTRPQDEITLTEGMPPDLIKNFKSSRKYAIEVGVTNIEGGMLLKKEGESEGEYQERLKQYVKLGNVSELDYQVFYSANSDPNNAPVFPNEQDVKKNNIDFSKFEPGQSVPGGEAGQSWEFLGLRRLSLDEPASYASMKQELSTGRFHPVYQKSIAKGPSFAPNGMTEDSVFCYSREKTTELATSHKGASNMGKRAFFVQFQPPSKPGWYKLRFASRTNRILGVSSEEKAAELNEESTVNIGTVQLKVKDLLKVKKELNSKLAKYNLPKMEDLGTSDPYKFDDDLKAAYDKAARDENANEAQSQINLYGYIAKLLAPGQSRNLDPNKGSIEFNIHVVKPDMPKADPTISLIGPFATFDKAAAVFEFSISPYQGAQNNVSGVVKDINGAAVARLNLKPADELQGGHAPAPGGKRDYRATVDKELSPGRYKVEITHTLNSKKADETADLDVFETKLTDASQTWLNNKLRYYSYYGNRIDVNIEPASGGKIKPQQFRIYLASDKNNQTPPIEGLQATGEQALPLYSDVSKVSVRVSWVQPYTNREIDLFPLQYADIKQDAPKVSLQNKDTRFSGTEKKIKVKVSNITILQPANGDKSGATKADVKVKLGKVDCKVQGYELTGEAQYNASENSVTVELSGSLPRGESKVRGTLRIPFITYAVNQLNGKTSEEKPTNIEVQVNYEPEREARPTQRRR